MSLVIEKEKTIKLGNGYQEGNREERENWKKD